MDGAHTDSTLDKKNDLEKPGVNTTECKFTTRIAALFRRRSSSPDDSGIKIYLLHEDQVSKHNLLVDEELAPDDEENAGSHTFGRDASW
eukprot:CAMPEP_0170180958 /NCGR_PEP_ID=MMETSP0040_2-20121228/23528_1 /TAXON_ID=641309 /ORGANISM="Lotharella oceanica, Strain CCMP622" /LENGTH=88 /DNA_ID=CAMNT_0010425787 /DNA_START=37 /DNA_END=300 /DNA_ORIENTATION=-